MALGRGRWRHAALAVRALAVRALAVRALAVRALAVTVLGVTALGVLGCGRTDVSSAPPADASRISRPAVRDAGLDAAMDTGTPRVRPRCEPREERCDGRDDDCDGLVDEMPPLPCDGGGVRLCVAGRWSACPRRCARCVPGTERVCYVGYCTFWAVQTCAGDGRTFGRCRERGSPSECSAIAEDRHDSPELERCCAEHGHCCLDRFDLDEDGDREDSIGDCEGVMCT